MGQRGNEPTSFRGFGVSDYRIIEFSRFRGDYSLMPYLMMLSVSIPFGMKAFRVSVMVLSIRSRM